MKYLYIDTSSSFLYTGIVENNKLLAEVKKEYGHNLSEFALQDIVSMMNNLNLTPKDISKHTGLAISSLTSMIDRMEINGLLKRKSDETDRRKTIISLTDLGKSLKKDFDKAVEEIKSYTFKNFKQEEIILFEYYLKRVFENLENLL